MRMCMRFYNYKRQKVHFNPIYSISIPKHLLKSNALNLNRHTFGQLVNSNTATGRLVNEELLVGGVHLSEVGHISQEDLYYIMSASAVLASLEWIVMVIVLCLGYVR